MGATPKERGNERAWKDHFRPVEKTPDPFDFLAGQFSVQTLSEVVQLQ
jgi:hypothetical protein